MANIYIVEDDTNIQEIEAIALKNSGHSVEQFDDAAHFYKKLEEKLPDLAILDLMLPDEDGYEIVKKLRQNPATKKLPVIMVTAKTSEIDMVRGLDIGADDYIKKPFSIIEFITRVKADLRRMHNAGIVLTREKIMERVWDTEFEGESRTVDMHIKTLRKKLGDSSRHIKTVRNVGYVME